MELWSGKRSVHLTVPSVVTNWETDAFCLNSHGFGLAQQKTLFVSPPFTLHLATPDSVFLGESFVLKATVTNNLQSCIKIKLSPAHSSDLSVTQLSSHLCTFCLCGGKSKTLRWTIAPTVLGTVTMTITAAAVDADTYCEGHPVVVPEKGHTSSKTRSIDVKAGGIEIRQTESWLLCSKGPVVRAVMDVEMPEVVVPGSLNIKVAAMGDVLNRLVHNLGEPLDFPYENGDWNIASMAINIYVLNYLKETQQLEHSMKEEEAVNFLKKGKFLHSVSVKLNFVWIAVAAYQTQLSFKDKSGAFSIFESGPRSSWLTALVLVTLYQAQPYIFIDENVINEARKWLECQQRENGCFKVSGKHLTKKKGGCAIDEVAYNAFILAAFLEMGVSPDDPVVKMGLCCLKESIKDLQNPFAAAISAWVFTLAKDMEPRAQLLHYLDTIAIKEGDVIYWSHVETETSVFSSLLISSYVILAKLTVTGSPRDLRSASHTFKWLVEHLNYYSTFSSTQDTMVAVKAIALYSKCMYTPTWSSTVSIWSPNDKVVFQLTPHNKLLYQEMVLQDINGKYSVKMKGTACALVQLSLWYNVVKANPDTSLSVDVQLELHPSRSKRLKLTMKMISLYSGHQLCTNMVVLEIQLPTGFCPLPQSLRSLRSGVDVEHVVYKDNRVFVYVRKLHKNIPIIHKLHLVQEYFVFNNKAVNVLIYDYNNPAVSGVTKYCLSSLTKDKFLPYHHHHHKDRH
ncbi:alpha-2-macroglobulin-like protein 1 [Oryzias latipes]|uniref:alpha-2-macroglobulin-like protein 1 n=1 Tax=Oryzias latipes TaxID=8090 RepID=UPI000CE26D8D|nr:alpha-2-macroglobulin-like protein 1 [Oryzias latipes]